MILVDDGTSAAALCWMRQARHRSLRGDSITMHRRARRTHLVARVHAWLAQPMEPGAVASGLDDQQAYSLAI
jgi:hypothetical protein